MCGISGIYGDFPFEKIDETLNSFLNSQKHRGPDGSGKWQIQNIGLAHNRLSIIDLSDKGAQPMTDDSGRFVLVFNGEIYNYLTLKDQLKCEYNFSSNSDSEVLLAAWKKWGIHALDKLKGMFAFAIFDQLENTLFLVRDRLGIKPLYYSNIQRGFIFASELRTLMNSGWIQSKIGKEAIAEFLSRQTVHFPNSILNGVWMLRPGHFLKVSGSKCEEFQWWSAPKKIMIPQDESTEFYKTQTAELLSKAVEKRLVSDVPIGGFLSGGIDSSAIVGLMAQSSQAPIQTFSLLFEEQKFDESVWSDLVAKKFNTTHHRLNVRPTDFLEQLPLALSSLDHPSADGLNSFLVSALTRQKGIKVAMSGIGGDELFCGYPHFSRLFSISKFPASAFYSLPLKIRKNIGSLIPYIFKGRKGSQLSMLFSAKNSAPESLYQAFRKAFSDLEIRNLLGQGIKIDPSFFKILNQLKSDFAALPILSRISLAEISTYTNNVLLRDTDQMSMAHGLEVRVPFLDHELLEFVLQVPDEIKYPHFPKQFLVESLGNLLPKQVVFRPKMGFFLPWESWLKNELKSFCEEKLASLESREGFFPGKISELWLQFLSNNPNLRWNQIWLLVVLEDWMQRNNVSFDFTYKNLSF